MSKHPISWHLECLHNFAARLNEDKKIIEKLCQELIDEQNRYDFYFYQILAARKKGKAEFDREKYMVKRVKIK